MATLLSQSNTDLDLFTRTTDFGEAVTYTPSGGSPSTVNGIFEEAAQFVEGLDASTVTTRPAFAGKTEDMSSAKKGDTITKGGVTYYVLRADKDGLGSNGMTVLVLSRDNYHG